MNTFLWDPEENPDEQYTDTKEQAQEASALIKHISKSIHRSKISKPRPPPTIFTHTAEAAVLLSNPLSMLPIGSPPTSCTDIHTAAPSILSSGGTGVATQASLSSGIAAVEGGQDESNMVSTVGLAVLQQLPGKSVQKGTGLFQEVQMRLGAVSIVSRHSAAATAAGPIVSSHRH
ncbi:hypothetical protein CEUSTIGMA_g6142.t1 [Chlamydomonas eustigma]|uniref:Uncharacterized protein n=1 Tax=Chlamydomonas eustigma TaxID=1157962 RepID=A0A250X6I9_9CHLO|nr:hypothetical protein CEUSTIGMA_g6142.t1 [Chlamydomonas eustigma]|eukprot:GAX78704.1 hypothetical protein CEUSTIGMA_g6142.t1 [Chlamydomonas eustigma]